MYAFHTGVRPGIGTRWWLNPGEVFPAGAATMRAEYVVTEVEYQGDSAFLIHIEPVKKELP
jgi:hypothetical protein